MTYLTDKLTELLGGGDRLRGAEGFSYGNWSPQGVRRVAIFPDALYLEYHKPYNKGRIKAVPLDRQKVLLERSKYSQSNQLAPLFMKKFMTLEEVIVEQTMGIDLAAYVSRLDHNSRVRTVSIIGLPMHSGEWIKTVKRMSDEQDIANNGAYDSLWAELGPTSSKQSLNGPAAGTWPTRFQMTPRVYKSDRADGPLREHFVGVARANGYGADGEAITGAGDVDEVVYNDKQTANILAHRANAAADAVNVELYKRIVHARVLLKKSSHSNAKFDAEGSKSLLRHLKKVSTKEGIPGLAYYVSEFADRDGLSGDLEVAYRKAKLFRERGEDKASTAVVTETGGYLPNAETVRDALRRSYISRAKRNLYVPDKDKFDLGPDTLLEWVNLLTGREFDYVQYSSALQAVYNGSSAEELEKGIAEARERFKSKDAQAALDDLERGLNEAESEEGTLHKFLVSVRDGSVNAARQIYIRHGKDNAVDAVDMGYSVVKKGIRIGVIAAGKGRPWGPIVSIFSKKLLDVSDDYVLPVLYEMLENIENAAMAREGGTWELTPELEDHYNTIFDGTWQGRSGVEAITRLAKASYTATAFRKNRIARKAKSLTGAPAFKEYLEKRGDLFDSAAVSMFEGFGYLTVPPETENFSELDLPMFDVSGFLRWVREATVEEELGWELQTNNVADEVDNLLEAWKKSSIE